MPGVGSSSPGKLLSPASMIRTLRPALVRTYAAVEPPAPLPMITTSKVERLVLPRTLGTEEGMVASASIARGVGELLGARQNHEGGVQQRHHGGAEAAALVVRIQGRV